MSTEPQLADLERKHQELEVKLEETMAHPGADSLEISELKRQKLQLKDQISQIQKGQSLH